MGTQIGFLIAGIALVSLCALRCLFLWIRKCVRDRRGIGTALKEVVLQELDNFRDPMGGGNEYDEDGESSASASPSETGTRQQQRGGQSRA